MAAYHGGLRADLGHRMLGRPKAEALQAARAGASYYDSNINSNTNSTIVIRSIPH